MARSDRYHHGDLRAALVREAAAMLETEGLEKLSLRSVARRAGVSHAAPYHHFADKTHLVAAVATEGFGGLTAAMNAGSAAQPASADALDRLSAIGRGYIAYAAEHPAVFRVMFRPELTGAHADHPQLRDAGMLSFGVLVEHIVAAQKDGLVASHDPEQLALGAWSAVHGVAVLWVDGPLQAEKGGGRSVEDLAELITLQIRRSLEGTLK